jgi:uncharacterized damage-inducible protein DinB
MYIYYFKQNYLIKLLLQKSITMSSQQPLTETFAINNRVNLYLLEAIQEAHLADVYPVARGRCVGKQWAHLHDVRLMWLKAAAPGSMNGMQKLEESASLSKTALSKALIQSGKAIELLFDQAAGTGKIKGFKPHPTAFLGYLLAHEAHHRGQIMVILKQNGHMVDKKIQFGIWEWGVR